MKKMTKENFKKVLFGLIASIFLFGAFPWVAMADMGPKASVNIEFQNKTKEECYATLLSKSPSTGPTSVWSGRETDAYYGENDPYCAIPYEVWKAFVEYEDEDGFYYLQITWEISQKEELNWGYYPPDTFKILLYYPKTETFIISDVYTRYAFDTYYTVDLGGLCAEKPVFDTEYSSAEGTDGYEPRPGQVYEIPKDCVNYDKQNSTDRRLIAFRSYNYTQEFGALCGRILLTVLVEVVIALLMGFHAPKQILALVVTNALTQLFLNLGLNFGVDICNISFHNYYIFYFFLELTIFVIEAGVYLKLLPKYAKKPVRSGICILYALAANLLSFGLGEVVLSAICPWMF